jgi:raffinose/stachyose/melibiose transport system permease protein
VTATIAGREEGSRLERVPARHGRTNGVVRSRRRRSSSRTAYAYLAPGFVLVAVFVLVPLVRTVWISFEQWNFPLPAHWTGLANYRQLWDDPELHSLFEHSFELIVFYSVLPICMALVITALLGARRVRFMTTYRAILFVPQAVSLVASAIAWQWMYAQNGPVNQLLRFFQVHSQTAWLGSFDWALPAIGLIGSWLECGFCLVLFLAGVQKIDLDHYDAAQVDGARQAQIFWYVTLPELRAEIGVALIVTVIAALKSFDLVYVLTDGFGGPGTSTNVPGLAIYQQAFTSFTEGSAASLAVVLAVLVSLVTLGIARLTRSAEPD